MSAPAVPRLGPDVRLELRGERPVLAYLGGAVRTPPPLDLHPLLGAVLAWSDAGWTAERQTDHLVERLGAPRAAMRELVVDAQVCFQRHFRNTGAESFVRLAPEPLLDGLNGGGAGLRSRGVVFPGDRAPFPLTLQWLVTRYCNRRCVYCYAGAEASRVARDAELSCERMCAILDEAAALGSYSFFPTGGEPLLRADAYDVIVHALSRGFTPQILTKQKIGARDAQRLAAAGLKQITLSIDSLDPDLAARLTGVRTFARDIAATLRELAGRGIAVSVRTAVTGLNVDDLPRTLERLDELGARGVTLRLYMRNLERHDDALVVSPEQLVQVERTIAAFRAGGRQMRLSHLAPPPPRSPEEGLGDDCIVCHNGLTSLLVMPDGRVSRCDKKLPGGDLIVGDLRHQSVHEVWHSPAMIASLKPSRELYRGTPCHDCGWFDECHARGRCFYNAYLTSGTLHGPQSNCPYVGGDVHVC